MQRVDEQQARSLSLRHVGEAGQIAEVADAPAPARAKTVELYRPGPDAQSIRKMALVGGHDQRHAAAAFQQFRRVIAKGDICRQPRVSARHRQRLAQTVLEQQIARLRECHAISRSEDANTIRRDTRCSDHGLQSAHGLLRHALHAAEGVAITRCDRSGLWHGCGNCKNASRPVVACCAIPGRDDGRAIQTRVPAFELHFTFAGRVRRARATGGTCRTPH